MVDNCMSLSLSLSVIATANTGGLLGLFMGFSVISLVEILYFMTIRPYCAIKRIGERRRRRANYNKLDPTAGGALDNRAVVTISSDLHRPFRVKFRQTLGSRRGANEVAHNQQSYPYYD